MRARLSTAGPVAVALMVVSLACGSSIPISDPDPGGYREVVENAEKSGLNVYWLGDSFTVGGVSFDRIDPFNSEPVDGKTSNVQLHYFSRAGPGEMDVRSVTTEVWANYREPNPAQFADIVREAVRVGGTPGTLTTRWLRVGRPPSNFQLIIERDTGVVIISTSSYAGENNEEVNPLMDRDQFLAAAEDVRPYPD